ncbi:unnamed protein product, partial [Choristocarpus tenellus]
VAILGAEAPPKLKAKWGINIAGHNIHPSKIRWGHMINAH